MIAMSDHKVTCQGCGYLGVRIHNPPHPWVPEQVTHYVPLDARTKGVLHAISGVPFDSPNPITTRPACSRDKFDLEEEYVEVSKSNVHGVDAQAICLDVITRPRSCSAWRAFSPGRSPAGHLDDEREQDRESQRRVYETQQEQSRRRFEWGLVLVQVVVNLMIAAATVLAGWMMSVTAQTPQAGSSSSKQSAVGTGVTTSDPPPVSSSVGGARP